MSGLNQSLFTTWGWTNEGLVKWEESEQNQGSFIKAGGEWLLSNWVSVEVGYTETVKDRICELDKGSIENILIKSVPSLIWISSKEVGEPRASYTE